jgi:hypothetical protein
MAVYELPKSGKSPGAAYAQNYVSFIQTKMIEREQWWSRTSAGTINAIYERVMTYGLWQAIRVDNGAGYR